MELTVRAYPKVNIGLYIGKKRADGYHSLCSIFQKAHELYDEITVSYEESSTVSVSVSGLDVKDNTMVKAVKLWLEKTDRKASVSIRIVKNIPMKAGLGGGSSDAASVLLALNRMNTLLTEEQLMEVGLEVGSDVPFFVKNCEAAYVTGRGEAVKPIIARKLQFELFDSGFSKPSTGEAYSKLDGIGLCEKLPAEDELVSMYNSDVNNWNFENSFSALYPSIPAGSFLTGSGSWCFRVKTVSDK